MTVSIQLRGEPALGDPYDLIMTCPFIETKLVRKNGTLRVATYIELDSDRQMLLECTGFEP